MNTLTLGVRNAFRNLVRSISLMAILGLSIGLCLVMLIAYQAVGQKISDIKSTIGNTITITPAGFSNFSQANNGLTTDQLSKVQVLPHVSNLTETLSDRLTTAGSASLGFDQNASTTNLVSPVVLGQNGNNFVFRGRQLPANINLPITVLGTTDTSHLNGTALTLASGSWIDGGKDTNQVLISSAMASKNNLTVGSTVNAYDTNLVVAGVFTSSNQGANNTLILALPTVQRLSNQTGQVTAASVTVDSLDNLSSVTAAVKQALGSTADVQSAQDLADATVQPLENVRSITLISLVGAVVASSAIILMSMVMIVRERRREIGILKALGASNVRVVAQFMIEALTLTVAGALVGIIIGAIGANPVTNVLVSTNITNTSPQTAARFGQFADSGQGGFRNFGGQALRGNVFQRGGIGLANSVRNISTNVGWSILAEGLVAALLIALVGSGVAGYLIARVKPSEVMRAE